MRALVKEATFRERLVPRSDGFLAVEGTRRMLNGRSLLEHGGGTMRLIALLETIQNRRHEQHGAENRNLQALRRSVRVDEEDSFSAVRLEEMVRDWLRGVFVWALCRCWHQFPVALRQFSAASGEPGRDSSIGSVDAMAAGSDRFLCAACFRFHNRGRVVEGARQFHFYGLHRPEPGGNRRTVTRV